MTREQLLENLRRHLPDASVDTCADWMMEHRIHFKVTRNRSTKIGDYRPPVHHPNHRISVNHNLNKFSFLITFVHEVAHLTNWKKHQHRVSPHGAEWKYEFKTHLHPFLQQQIFPHDISAALHIYMDNPAASTCTDKNLYRILKRYDADSVHLLLETLPQGSLFKVKNYNNVFEKGECIRKNFLCMDVATKRQYRISPIAEVEVVG